MSIKVEGFKSSELLSQINDQLLSDADFRQKSIDKIKGAIVFNIKNKQGSQQAWLLDLKNKGTVTAISQDDVKNHDAQIITTDINLKKLITGKASAQTLFLSGRLKLRGDVAKAAEVESVFKNGPKAKL